MEKLVLDAPAKLNLTLDILRRRPDGYHELSMVMQTVSLADRVTVRLTGRPGELTAATDRAELPDGPGNLMWKAADAFFRGLDMENPGVALKVEKRIPAQAGMAGGSADAAAVLRGLRALLRPELPAARLEELGSGVGSDVPFCVRGGTALAEGRGERLRSLPPLADCWLVLCKPPFGLATPELFGRVRAEELRIHPSAAAMERALESRDLIRVAAALGNSFEEVLGPEEEAIFRIRRMLLDHGAAGALMTGSGPTVFGLFRERPAAEAARAALAGRETQVFLARPARME